jgi:hypothetical protein
VAFLTAAFEEDWAPHLPEAAELAEVAARLPLLCGLAECEMEKWWCRRFLGMRDLAISDLARFWYFENYWHLVTAELSLLTAAAFDGAVLLGSGALPLTAILLAEMLPHLRVRCVDMDGEACNLADCLVDSLGLSGRIEISQKPAENIYIHPGEAIICASLLDAPQIYKAFSRMFVRSFIVRDVEGLFRLCYRRAWPPPDIYRLNKRTSASTCRINISCLYEAGHQQPAS